MIPAGMFLVLRRRSFSAAAVSFKISPAALCHANSLGISLEGIKPTGPKGHIIKNDILSISPAIESDPINTFSCIIELSNTNCTDSFIRKCLESVTRGGKVSIADYKFLPDIGLLQIQMKLIGPVEEAEKIKNLLKMYLNDSIHLLL